MYQEGEIVNLVMGVAALPALLLLLRRGWLPRLPLLFAGLFAVLAAYVFTVAEGFVWNVGFNLLEHLALALAGVFFGLGTRRLPGDLARSGRGLP